MPKRNVVILVACVIASLVAWAARERGGHGHRFGEVMAAIERHAIEPVDRERLFTAAVEATVSQIDEHSAYLRDADRSDLESVLDQEFGGVGLELAVDPSTRQPIVVTSVFPGPAWRAGIGAGDRIVAIDGLPTAGRGLREVVATLRGDAGQPVRLTVVSPGPAPDSLDPLTQAPAEIPREMSLVRQLVELETVTGDRRTPDGGWQWTLEDDPGLGYVRIESFGERTADEFAAAIDRIAAGPDLRGLVIDLRGNPGGLVRSAAAVCDLLLEEGPIVMTRARRSDGGDSSALIDVRRATAGASLPGVPVAVLVDGLTASAAEIVAACLQDSGRAVVAGSRTYGKGTVQSLIPLSDGRGLLKLTTSEYLRPTREPIHRRPHDGDDATWGVRPDPGCEVAPTAEAIERLRQWRRARSQVPPPAQQATPVAASRPSPAREIDAVLARGLEVMASR